jgi:N-acetylmuramoyl-L-alanine amidase
MRVRPASVLLVGLVGFCIGVSAAFAAPPFGSFGGKVGGGNSGAGLLPLHGWALDDDGVAAVDILVDGVIVGRAIYGRTRPVVTDRFPGFPDSAAPGFAFQLDTTRYLNGLHTIGARVRSETGEVTNLNSRVFEFLNLTHNLAPFGEVEFPNPQAELRGNCNLADPARRFSVVSGYALDAGVDADDQGVGYVELLIDRAIWANTNTDCRFSTPEGGLSDCYGLRRVDVERRFPDLVDAPHSGFRFVLDVGFLIEAVGYSQGSHNLIVRGGDVSSQVRNIAELRVTFVCDENLGNEESFGEIRRPRPGNVHGGTIQVDGWALDWEGVDRVAILVDGIEIGTATRGFADPPVTALFPGYPDSATPGFRFALDTTAFSNGSHVLEALVRDDLGNDTYIGKRSIVIGNPNQ